MRLKRTLKKFDFLINNENNLHSSKAGIKTLLQ